VWIRSADDQFTRREVEHARPVEGGWFVAEGFKPGEKIVVGGAQLLLSEELKSKFQTEE
jgi:multidrug efflux pump subunit AcrA (membrane-fusion protein)